MIWPARFVGRGFNRDAWLVTGSAAVASFLTSGHGFSHATVGAALGGFSR